MRRPTGPIAPYALLCVLSLALFWPSFDNGFRDDDYNFIYKTIHSDGLAGLTLDSAGLTFFRPGAWLLFAAEFKAFGMHSGRYLIVNWTIHLLNSLLLLLVLRRAGYRAAVAWLAAGLFVLGYGHYGKQVMWACTSGPLASVALALCAVYVAIESTDPRAGAGARSLAPLGGLLVLVAASFHESALVAPAIALFLCLKVHGPWREMRKGPVLWTFVGLSWIGILLLVSPVHDTYNHAWRDIAMTPLRLVRYVGIMALPVQNSALLERAWPALSANAHVVQQVVGMAILVTAIVLARARGLRVSALVLWMLVALAPYTLVGMSDNWIELRYVYFAAMAFDTVLVLWLLDRARGLRWTTVALAFAVTVTVTSALERKYAEMATSEENLNRREWLPPELR